MNSLGYTLCFYKTEGWWEESYTAVLRKEKVGLWLQVLMATPWSLQYWWEVSSAVIVRKGKCSLLLFRHVPTEESFCYSSEHMSITKKAVGPWTHLSLCPSNTVSSLFQLSFRKINENCKWNWLWTCVKLAFWLLVFGLRTGQQNRAF